MTTDRARRVSASGQVVEVVTRTRSRRIALGALALVLLAVVGIVTWFIGYDARPQARAGRLVVGDENVPSARSVEVREPWGRLEVAVGPPRRSLPADVASTQGNIRPPDGGRFVGVEVSESSGSVEHRVALPPYPRTHLSLVADGRSIPLETPTTAADPCFVPDCVGALTGDAVWVAVPGAATTLQVAAEFGGVTQTVDVDTGTRHAGAAASLYAASAALPTTCGRPVLTSGFRLAADAKQYCTVTSYRSPYVSGAGWAPTGSEWVVVSPTVSVVGGLQRKVAGGARTVGYLLSDPDAPVQAIVRIAGTGPARPLVAVDADLTELPSSSADASVFAVPAASRIGVLSVSAAVPVVPEFADSLPADLGPLTATMTWTIR